MSRIQDILSKAERDGTMRRTRSLTDEYPAEVTPDPRGFDTTDARRGARPIREPRAADSSDRQRAAGDTVQAHSYAPASSERQTSRRTPAGAPDARIAGRMTDNRPRSDGATALAPSIAPTAPLPISDPASTVTPPGTGRLDPLLVAALAPTSLAAEQYRSLRTRLKRAESGRALRAIAVTSPAKGDGKSLTAANLALTMAEEFQQRVLLVDADLRRPSVHQLFGLAKGPGLADVLMNGADLEHALVTLPEHYLTILPAGVPPAHPAELLGSATMRRVLDALRSRFDRILIDVPPVAPLADLHVLAPMVDGLLMIVRAGVTQKPAIERALSGLDPSKVLGLVLNETGADGGETYNYEGYGYLAG
jgi:capsular exopolysaccharide synthesis family protein